MFSIRMFDAVSPVQNSLPIYFFVSKPNLGDELQLGSSRPIGFVEIDSLKSSRL